MAKKVLELIIIIVGIGLIFSLGSGVLRLIRVFEQVKTAEERVAKLEKEKQELVDKKEYFQSEKFVEEEARNKLNMVKPGETIVILPPNVKELIGKEKQRPTPSPFPSWRQWWNLFF